MTTKLQAKHIKTEIKTLERENRTDTAASKKEVKSLDRQVASLLKKRERLVAGYSARTEKRDKRIAILTGRL